MDGIPVAKITIHQLDIPFRRPFGHGSAVRSAGDNIILALELADGTVGYGETLARDYVTGETRSGVVDKIVEVFVPILAGIRAESFGQVMEVFEHLPFVSGTGEPLYAARCAVELALLDAYGRCFRRDPTVLAGWIDQVRWEPPGATARTSYSGIIGFSDPATVGRYVRLMRLWRLRDFKIKVGDSGEFDRVAAVTKALSSSMAARTVTLRVDANGAWSRSELKDKVDALETFGITYLEQPTTRDSDDSWMAVQHESGVNLIADESLVSFDDAERLVKDYRVGVFNIRIAKNGGLLAALKLASFAYGKGIEVQLGCMVGETEILTRAGQWFAAIVPDLLFAEGGYGRLLLRGDVVRWRGRFRYGGRIAVPRGPGLGVRVDGRKLRAYASADPVVVTL